MRRQLLLIHHGLHRISTYSRFRQHTESQRCRCTASFHEPCQAGEHQGQTDRDLPARSRSWLADNDVKQNDCSDAPLSAQSPDGRGCYVPSRPSEAGKLFPTPNLELRSEHSTQLMDKEQHHFARLQAEGEEHEIQISERVGEWMTDLVGPEGKVDPNIHRQHLGNIHEQVKPAILQTEEAEMLQSEQQDVPNDERNSAPANVDPTQHVYDYTLGYATYVNMVQTIRKVRELGLPDQIKIPTKSKLSASTWGFSVPSDRARQLNRVLKLAWRKRLHDPEYQRILSEQMKLPIHKEENVKRLQKLIANNDVVVLVSETGSGKTTQLPQLILDWKTSINQGVWTNIICTQPRRIAAMSVARRVAEEQRSEIGEHVGFSVRFAKQQPRKLGSIGYWTAGVLLKSLYDEPEHIMTRYSHLIIDEVHERDVTTDLVLNTLRDLIRTRRQNHQYSPRIILMSATIDALDFQRYFEEPFPGGQLRVASLEVPGRNFGVEIHMLNDFVSQFEQHSDDSRFMALLNSDKDYLASEDKFADSWQANSSSTSQQPWEAQSVPIDLAAATIIHTLKSSDHGDILVFLPGIGEIDKVKQSLQSHTALGLDFNDETQLRLYKLHASLWETNDLVFEPVPEGCRRIVLSTNIAQTSITLPDVVHVIDAGQQRRMGYNPLTRVNQFQCHWIDQSTAKQRQGRAGRTRPGHYWTLFTQARYDSMRARPLPEIRSIDLTGACLAIKAQLGDRELVKNVLARCLDPPDMSFIYPAVEELKKLRMLDDDENITPLGRFAAWFPLQPATARALLLGVLFRCLEPMLIMAAHSSDKPLIHNPFSLKSQMQSVIHFAKEEDDDRAAFVSAFQSYNSAVHHRWTDEIAQLENLNIKYNAYREMLNVSRQICELMSAHKVLPLKERDVDSVFEQLPAYLSENASSGSFVKSLALAMQHSSIGVYNASVRSYYAQATRVAVRPFSVNAKEAQRISDRLVAPRDGKLLSYSLLLTLPGDHKPTMSETSNITPLMAMLFGGSIELFDKDTILINGWLKYRVRSQDHSGIPAMAGLSAVELIFEFRKTLDRFIQIACSDLRSNYFPQARYGLSKASVGNLTSPLSQDNQLTTAFTAGLRAVIESDADLWDEYVLAAGDVAQGQKRKAKT